LYKYQQIKIISVIIITAIIISVISANRSDYIGERNDTYNYYAHYDCGIEAASPIDCKKEIGSSKLEFGYDYFPYLIGKLFGTGSFWYYKLIVALFINIVILLMVYLISGKAILPVVLLLLDYRFYAYSSNIVRHGLALTISLLAIYAYLNKNKIKSTFISLLAFLFHISSASMLVKSSNKFNVKLMIVVFISVLLFTSALADIILNNKEFFLSINDKIIRYIEANEGQKIRYPIHYMFVFIAGLYVYKNTKNPVYITIYNTLFSLILFSLLASIMGLLDRITAYMPPFIYILMYFIYRHMLGFFKQKNTYIIAFNFVVILAMIGLFVSNYYMVLIHLNMAG